jgi:heme exporter protein CcmD
VKEFLAMGGYWQFVWPAFAITFIVMAALMISASWQRRKIIAGLKRKLEIQQRESKT